MPGRAGGGDHLERRLDPELGLDHGDDGLRADAARPHTTDRALVRIGRLTTTIALIVAILWAPQIQHFASLWAYLQSVLSYTTPPIVAVFLIGIFWERANRHGAFATLTLGIGIGLIALVLIEVLGVVQIQFLYAAGISFVSSIVVLVSVSLMSAPEPKEKTADLTWHPALWHAETEELKSLPWWQNYRFGALALFAATAGMVIWFW
jgi:solute:Na+ symporter, SSS family